MAKSSESQGKMSDKIVLVSSPDDVLFQGLRILLVDLTSEQSQIISQALLSLENIPKIIIYTWKSGDPIPWLLDKNFKSQAIILNAESDHQDLIGYFISKNNSYYFGNLRSLKDVNNSVLYDIEQSKDVLTEAIERYGKTQR